MLCNFLVYEVFIVQFSFYTACTLTFLLWLATKVGGSKEKGLERVERPSLVWSQSPGVLYFTQIFKLRNWEQAEEPSLFSIKNLSMYELSERNQLQEGPCSDNNIPMTPRVIQCEKKNFNNTKMIQEDKSKVIHSGR